jgi:hypothetical protein
VRARFSLSRTWLAFVQQMRAERHDAIARLELADDERRFAEGRRLPRPAK